MEFIWIGMLLLLLQGLDPVLVMVNSSNNNGCAVVTPLPSAKTITRVAFKFYFAALTKVQWSSLTDQLVATESTITAGHIRCGSSLNFQSYPSGTPTRPVLSPDTSPKVR